MTVWTWIQGWEWHTDTFIKSFLTKHFSCRLKLKTEKLNCCTCACTYKMTHDEMMNETLPVFFPPTPILHQEPGGNHTPPQLSPSVGQAAYTAGVPGGSLDVQHLIMQADARRRQRSTENYFEDVPRSKLERQMAQVSMVRMRGKEWMEGWMNRKGGGVNCDSVCTFTMTLL